MIIQWEGSVQRMHSLAFQHGRYIVKKYLSPNATDVISHPDLHTRLWADVVGKR